MSRNRKLCAGLEKSHLSSRIADKPEKTIPTKATLKINGPVNRQVVKIVYK